MPKTSRNGKAAPPASERIEVRKSGVHGKGVYATAPIRKGAQIIEYTGQEIPWKEAMDLPSYDPSNPFHTFFFSIENGNVINAGVDGNEARWINHSCEPNCETTEKDNRIFIYALRALRPGEELFYDYRIIPAERRTKQLERDFACFCGSAKCRGTMLEPRKKRRRKKRAKAKTSSRAR